MLEIRKIIRHKLPFLNFKKPLPFLQRGFSFSTDEKSLFSFIFGSSAHLEFDWEHVLKRAALNGACSAESLISHGCYCYAIRLN